MIKIIKNCLLLTALLIFSLNLIAQTTTYDVASSVIIPAGIASVTVTVYGGGGGTGGQDCGLGCTSAAAGQVGYVVATYNVTAGNTIAVFPGGKGGNGANSVAGIGGGAAGLDTYTIANYDGGAGGNAGTSGTSGGGGGGGAASLVTINGTIRIVAGGAGGGGGSANVANSGYVGNNTYSSNGNFFGGSGLMPSGDGGGSAGGGGGRNGGKAGGLHPAGGESAGDGGFRGNNFISGAPSAITNTSTTWTNGGRIIITYNKIVPVTYLSFTSAVNQKNILLNWRTASEQNSLNFTIQRSNNSTDWKNIGVVAAAGNSNIVSSYSFVDNEPVSGANFYRLLQKDLDGNQTISKTISANFKSVNSLVKIFPNPVVNAVLNITLSKKATIYLYSNSGSKLMEKTLTAGQHKIDVSNLAKGNYFIKAGTESEGFIIQ